MTPFAQWNEERDLWETEQIDLLSELSDAFSETWPRSGMTRAGTAYALPTSALRTADSGSSSPRGLLQTPSVADAMGGHLSRGGTRSGELLLKGQVKAMASSPPPPAETTRDETSETTRPA
jgi:hypothetical protein